MIALGCDHAGFELKEAIKEHLSNKGIEITDFGTYSTESVDYPIFAYKTAKAVASGECEYGILCCGTGIGISIAANKVKGIRAAVCSEEFSAEMTRRHNDANILCLGGRIISKETAIKLVDIFLSTPSESGNHKRRIDLISDIENNIEIG
ncbi:MAG: ribose 5-phosphate isomerase B [Bacillota bacterium]|nr:ribose 5-phosphate isomerase B [Bacillota bacterium]